ncbi:hypothetical protein MFLO_16174 [Listeria floridensis FSL S10-1187]|uniref:Uncharacterized protein n=1 Tax=Listeria floridensis FSL S10-1187 TaxID=1265817 RepID=A0ABN0RB01_9LIST|nr:hypothetical protein [Listeria floridensis]EUJ23126.1 hypothetical protein MFLO_16174 [Listeria floridensis FSL S10-1187]
MKSYYIRIYTTERCWPNERKLRYEFSKYDITLDDLKTALVKRMGNLGLHYRAKRHIYEAKSVEELVQGINNNTRFKLDVRVFES